MPSRRFLAADLEDRIRALLSGKPIGISDDLPRFDDRAEVAEVA